MENQQYKAQYIQCVNGASRVCNFI